MKKQIHVFYSGRVQGVGFRFTAEETAREFGVKGWVKNLRDGRVEVLGQADEKALHKFLEGMRTGSMRNFITDTQISWGALTDAFPEFEIQYF